MGIFLWLRGTSTEGQRGGGAKVTFDGAAGQVIRITLTAVNSSMEPYGDLENPDGTSSNIPPINGGSNGVNTALTTLGKQGTYTLTVFDGTNLGGIVNIRIEFVSVRTD